MADGASGQMKREGKDIEQDSRKIRQVKTTTHLIYKIRPLVLFFPPQGSLPLPWDVAHLVREFNIGAVVNMTIEYSGPLEEYALHGVEQLHLPTVDTAAPTLEQVHT